VPAALLDKLHSASARGRRGHLAFVRTMIEKAAPGDPRSIPIMNKRHRCRGRRLPNDADPLRSWF
jgi:hypothetical protein